MVKVILRKGGALSVGKYRAGVTYEVDKTEADRLVKVKGFEIVESVKTKEGK